MKTQTPDIEQMIEDILGLSKPAPVIKRPRGRARKEKPPVWSLCFYDASKNTTYALISLCIKEDPDQSLEQLALRLSAYKSRPPRECLRILKKLKAAGKLGYYDEDRFFRSWQGEEDARGLENLCG